MMGESQLSADDANEQASRMSALDLYEDLLIKEDDEDGNRVLSMREILSEKHSLQEQNALLLRQLMEVKLGAQKLEEERVNLQKNFDNLLATAKVELERKNGLLSCYVGGSAAPITRPTSSSSHISKEHACPSSKKKGLLELYKGRRVNENELTSLSTSSGPVMPHATTSSPALLQSRGEKRVGVATLVIGSSFENTRVATSINISCNQQTSARILDSEGQNPQPKGQMSNPMVELAQVSSKAHHSANDNFSSTLPKSHYSSSKFKEGESQFRVQRSQEIAANELRLNPNVGRTRSNDIPTASASEVGMLPNSGGINDQLNVPPRVAPKMRKVNETRSTTPKSLDVCQTRRDACNIGDRDRIRHSSNTRNNVAERSSKLTKDKSVASKSSSSEKHSSFFGSNNHKDERTSFKENSPRNRTSTTKATVDHEKTRNYDKGRRGIDLEKASAAYRHCEKDLEHRNSERRTSKRESLCKDPLAKTKSSLKYTDRNRITEKRQHRGTEERERCSSVSEKPFDQKKSSENSSGGVQKFNSERMKKSSDQREKRDQKYQTSPNESPRKTIMDVARSMKRDRKSVPKDDSLQSKKSSKPDHPEMQRRSFKDSSIGISAWSKVGKGGQSNTLLNSTLEPSGSRRITGCAEFVEKPKSRNQAPEHNNLSPQVSNFDYKNSARGVTITTNGCDAGLDLNSSPQKSNHAHPVKSTKVHNLMNKAPLRKSPRKHTHPAKLTKQNVSSKPATSMPPATNSRASTGVGDLLLHSQSATQIREATWDYMGSPQLDLDYDEDSLMNHEIMQPDYATETNVPSDDARLKDQLHRENLSLNPDKNVAASCGTNLRGTVSDTESAAFSNPQTSDASHHNSSPVPDRKPNMTDPQSTNTIESVDKHRPKETSNIVAKSDSKERFSNGNTNVTQLAGSPKYQPRVRLVDIKKSPMDKGIKRRICYGTEGEVPVKRCKSIGRDKLGKKVRQFLHDDETPSKCKKLSDPLPINLKPKTNSLNAGAPPLAVRQQGNLRSIVPPELKGQSNSNIGFESAAGPEALSSATPASTTFMDVGMEIEVETNPNFISETKKQTKKKRKKHRLKIKIKPFKRNNGSKAKTGDTNFGKSLAVIETPCVSSADDPSDVLPDLSAVHRLPEASPVLSQWLDSAKKKGKKEEKSKKLVCNSREESVDIKSTCNAVEVCTISVKTKDIIFEELADNSGIKGERAELFNAVASICEGETTSLKLKNTVNLVFNSTLSPQKYRAGNLMRSYSNAALKWLIHLSSERLKSWNGTTEQSLDLFLKKRQQSANIRPVTKEEHPTVVVNLFTEKPGNNTKSLPIEENVAKRRRNYSLVGTSTISQSAIANKALELNQQTLDSTTPKISHPLLHTDGIQEATCHHGFSTLSSTIEGNRKKQSDNENFDNLFEKHAKNQKKQVLKCKDKVDQSQQPAVKRRKPRRVALERVEMPYPKLPASQSKDMVSPSSRSLWMTSLDKCQERRKERARWSSEVSKYDEAHGASSGLHETDNVFSETEKIPENATADEADTTRKMLHAESVLPDSVPIFQKHIQPSSQLHKSFQLPDQASSSSLFSVGELSSSSWQLSEESRCRLYSFAKAVQVLSPPKSSPSRGMPPRVYFNKKNVKRRVLQSP